MRFARPAYACLKGCGALDIWVVIIYIGFLLFYGIWQGYRVKGASGFATSTKRHGLFVMFASLTAAFIGGGFSAGNAAEVYRDGIGNIVGLLGFSVGQIIVGLFIIRRAKIPANAISPGTILEPSYGRAARVTAGASSALLCAGVLGAQIAAIGNIFNVLLNVPYHMGVIIGFSVVIIYATAGGLNAIIAAEMVEFLLLAVGLPILAFCAIRFAGGVEAITAALPPSHLDPLNGRSAFALASLFLTLALGEALCPSFLQRMMATRDRATMSRATVLSGLASIPVFVLTGIVGLAARAALPDIAPDAAMPMMVLSALPVGVKGLLMAASLAIVMSSADGLLSSAAVGIVNDIAEPLSRGGFSDRTKLRAMRATSVAIGVLGMSFALLSNEVFSMLLLSYAAWAPVMLVPMAAALLGRRGGTRQFLIPALAGGVAALIWGTLAGVAVNLVLFIILDKFGIDKHPRRC